jgi:hypothetical protein
MSERKIQPVVRKFSYKDDEDEINIDYWLSKTEMERLGAITQLRMEFWGYENKGGQMIKVVKKSKLCI